MTRHAPATPAADAFAGLGLDETEWTPAMTIAVRQCWSGLPTDAPVADLRAAIANIPQPTRDTIAAQNPDVTDADELSRLCRNAKVNAWRKRTQLQAALDARSLRFAKMRAARKVAA